MKIKATKTTGKKLNPGDLFSAADQTYWDNVATNQSIGEKVYIRTNTPCPKTEEDAEIYRIEII